MKAFKNICCILFLVCFIYLSHVISVHYDFLSDKFVFYNEKTKEISSFDINELNSKYVDKVDFIIVDNDLVNVPRIRFGNVFSTRYKFYRICGYFAFISLLIAYVILYLILSNLNKLSSYEVFSDRDTFTIFLMTSLIIAFFLAAGQVLIYDAFYLNSNDAYQYRVQVYDSYKYLLDEEE